MSRIAVLVVIMMIPRKGGDGTLNRLVNAGDYLGERGYRVTSFA
jgi:hypothetical protein